MSEANRHSLAEPLQTFNIIGLANKQLLIEKAYLLIDRHIAEMAQQDAKAALTKIKAALRARLPDN